MVAFTDEQRICDETLARVRGSVAVMRAEQHIINVAMGWWTERTPEGYARQLVRLSEAVAAYHAMLAGER